MALEVEGAGGVVIVEVGATGEVGEAGWLWWTAELVLWELMLWERGKVKGTRKGTFATAGGVCMCMKEGVFDSSASERDRKREGESSCEEERYMVWRW